GDRIGRLGPPLTAASIVVQATAGTPITAQVASFTDADRTATPSNLTVAIDWGDGTTSSGVTARDASRTFDVAASHTEAQSGSRVPIQVAVARPARVAPAATVSPARGHHRRPGRQHDHGQRHQLHPTAGTLVDVALDTVGDLSGVIPRAGGAFRKAPTPR